MRKHIYEEGDGCGAEAAHRSYVHITIDDTAALLRMMRIEWCDGNLWLLIVNVRFVERQAIRRARMLNDAARR